MRKGESVPFRPVTSEHVLAILRDEYRHACELDPEASPGYDLAFDSTVRDWRDACDLLPWRKLGRALSEQYGIRVADGQWRAVLEPAEARRLQGVCDLIASHASLPVVQPAKWLGAECRNAGAFLAMRTWLESHGVPAGRLRPSTPLAPYLAGHLTETLDAARVLAPGAAPVPEVQDHPALAAFGGLLVAGLLGALVFVLLGLLWPKVTLLGWAAMVAAGVGILGISIISHIRPSTIRWGELQTFADLARVVASATPPST